MRSIEITPAIRAVTPHCKIGVIEASITNTLSTEPLWVGIDKECDLLKTQFQLSEINKRTQIAATREVYKRLGKDPNRYRPSAEALCRRVLRNMELYRINAVVDLINWVSMRYGYSIGGFDAAQIVGDLHLGVGEVGEPFNAIGRGMLNIAGLPLYRDRIGGIGTPTSDEERTKLSTASQQLLMLINDYSGGHQLSEAVVFSTELLEKYAAATITRSTIIY